MCIGTKEPKESAEAVVVEPDVHGFMPAGVTTSVWFGTETRAQREARLNDVLDHRKRLEEHEAIACRTHAKRARVAVEGWEAHHKDALVQLQVVATSYARSSSSHTVSGLWNALRTTKVCGYQPPQVRQSDAATALAAAALDAAIRENRIPGGGVCFKDIDHLRNVLFAGFGGYDNVRGAGPATDRQQTGSGAEVMKRALAAQDLLQRKCTLMLQRELDMDLEHEPEPYASLETFDRGDVPGWEVVKARLATVAAQGLGPNPVICAVHRWVLITSSTPHLAFGIYVYPFIHILYRK